MFNIFLGTKEALNIEVGDIAQTLPHGQIFTAHDEEQGEMYIDNYLVTGFRGSFPYVHIFKNNKNGYELIVKEFIPDWTYTPVDWTKDESIGSEYSLELFDKIVKNLFP